MGAHDGLGHAVSDSSLPLQLDRWRDGRLGPPGGRDAG